MSTQKVFASGSTEPKPSAKGTLRMYGNRFCPYVYRVRLVLAAKNIPHEVINIHLQNKPEWYFAKNPEGKVPAIEFDNHILYESLIIADYLDQVYPQEKLWPNDPLEVAKGKIIIERVGKLAALNAKIYIHKDYTVFKDIVAEFNVFNKILQKLQKQYFSGDKAGMVDYMIWPFIETALSFTEMGLGENIPEFLSIDERPAFTMWIEKLQNDPAVQKATVGKEILKKFFQTVLSGQIEFDIGLTD